jgi:uncharacterized protein (DUF885 family)
MSAAASASASLLAIADAALERRRLREPMLAVAEARPANVAGFVDEGTARADATFFADIGRRLEALDREALDAHHQALHSALAVDARHRVEAADFHALDFVITPYRGGDLHVDARRALSAHPLADGADCDAYMALLRDYARLLRDVLSKTRDQAARGLRLSAAAVPMARQTAADLLQHLDQAVLPAASRQTALTETTSQALEKDIRRCIEDELAPPLRGLVAELDDDYLGRAPAGVGLWQYPGGPAYYDFLIRQRADSGLGALQIHDLGLDGVEALQQLRTRLRRELEPGRSADAFDRALQTDARWHADTPSDVEACFTGHLARLTPLLPQWFGRLPLSGWAVTRADPAIERGMSFGYYQPPSPADPLGRYRYNGTGLDQRSLIGAAHLIYHELLPGHHLQLSLQKERAGLHPLQAHLYSMASIEGWAVYASELAREMGLLTGYDLYGHAVMQSWLAARLVVDTGLNAMRWSLDRAAAYLRQHTLESQAVIDTELLRYSTDIPAQALAYDLGRQQITGLRQTMQQRWGAAFDVRTFHDALLEVAGFPFDVIRQRFDRLQPP